MNTLFHGDNLDILREHIGDETVDLIYLDPPFNSNRDYNVLFKEKSGIASPAQMEAFTDTWTWDQAAEAAMVDMEGSAPSQVVRMINALRDMVGDNDLMAYLAMMCQRLLELHRVLKPTGSIYLHCDPTASHYLKVLLDTVFGVKQFRNEIIWKRTSSHNDSLRFASIHDCILYYSKTNESLWNSQHLPHNESYVKSHYNRLDDKGRQYRLDNIVRSASMGERPNLVYEYKGYTPHWGWRVIKEKLEQIDRNGRLMWVKSGTPYLIRYLDEMPGPTTPSIWDDIPPVNSQARERLGYPTQKPLALLERIISASSNPGDIVLDPFCGCGTAVAAAEKMGRQWIGIDVTYLAIAVMKQRIRDHFPDAQFEVRGIPRDLTGAKALFEQGRYQFQWWAVDALGINARPFGDGKKGSDRGIDGEFFYSNESGRPVRGIIQVKGGKTGSADIRDLRGTMEREGVDLAIFVCLQHSTPDMRRDAASAGFVESGFTGRSHPRIQILTIEDLFDGKRPDIPHQQSAHQAAPRIRRNAERSTNLPVRFPVSLTTEEHTD